MRMFVGFLVFIVFGVGLLVVVGVGTSEGKGPDWWAAWGQWVGGVGSLVAAVAALWIAWEGWARTDREARERALVLPRLVIADYGYTKGSGWGILITNGSGGSITRVRVLKIEVRDRPEGMHWGFELQPEVVVANVIKPFEDHHIALFAFTAEKQQVTDFAVWPVVTIRFTDPDGKTWERVGDAEPTPAKPDPLERATSRSARTSANAPGTGTS